MDPRVGIGHASALVNSFVSVSRASCVRRPESRWQCSVFVLLVSAVWACGEGVAPLRRTTIQSGEPSEVGGVPNPQVPAPGVALGEGTECLAGDCDEGESTCGNSTLDPGEGCDDSNRVSGDGCSSSCRLEPSFECPSVGSACVVLERCGDGQRQGAEACDDGNTRDGDGCSAACDAIEFPFSCPPAGGPCAANPVCGDGRVTGAEVCDDLNNAPGDGCSGDCLIVEPGFRCPSPGQLCLQPVVCGDGVLGFGEICDDGNLDPGDGCTEACRRQAFFVCGVPGAPCESLVVCGDGTRLGPEACDDGNVQAGDGCNAGCELEPGWSCLVPGSRCEAAVCGDGLVAGAEQCDDANASAGDGCAGCRFEPGFVCENDGLQSPSSICRLTVCNDGVREGGEACDDGNLVVGDGCSPLCAVEPQCTEEGCSSSCGDGLRLPGDSTEQCDDGNTLDGDGCSAGCTVEPGFACADVEGALPETLELPVTFRDFIATPVAGGPPRHPDFELFSGAAQTPGLVASVLGPDNRPVYTGLCEVGQAGAGCPFGAQTTGRVEFSQWYRATPGVNQSLVTQLSLPQRAGAVYQFPSTLGDRSFFPLDGEGWVGLGLETASVVAGTAHNFGFTSEIRHWFEFRGDERLTFAGDDDVWVFINRRLALDLGGLHERREQTIVLEADTGDAVCTQTEGGLGTTPCGVARRPLGLVVGEVYEVALFHAERHTTASNFDLTLGGFVNVATVCQGVCGDGIRTADESCDDGLNDGSYGSCTADCLRGPHCGDGILQAPNEQCDEGINAAGYGEVGCAPGCLQPSRCGDGNLDSSFGESCDDGVNDGSYGSCTPECQVGPRCGDGVLQREAGEQCDDGQNDGTYGTCGPGCVLGARCGDGVVQSANDEQCDDGQNDGSYGTCEAQCRLGRRCGDGVTQAAQGEQCDDGTNTGSYGQCAVGCLLGPRCGDGVVQAPEECDEGSRAPANGCSVACRRSTILLR